MLSSLSGLQISHFMFVEHFIDGVSRKHVCQKNFRRDPESTVISHITHIIWPISFRPYKMIVNEIKMGVFGPLTSIRIQISRRFSSSCCIKCQNRFTPDLVVSFPKNRLVHLSGDCKTGPDATIKTLL